MVRKKSSLLIKFVALSALIPVFLLLSPLTASSSVIQFSDSWGKAGYNLVTQRPSGVEVLFSITEMALEDIVIDGQTMQMVYLPGVILPNNAGAPNLPATGRFIAIPQGARVVLSLVDYRTETFTDLDLAPAPPIPLDTDTSPLIFEKDPAIYSRNAYYPESPVQISEPTDIRGVDVVILGITPFQYNPVTRELLVYRDLRVRIDFVGGNGHFGEDRLRSRYWDPILEGNILNYGSLPSVNFNRIPVTDEDNVEYLIIVPDEPVFIAWADSIKAWRKLQGIITGVTRLSEIGGNNATAIENYINTAYNTWDIPPVAVLLLSDYQSTGDPYGITAPTWNGYCASDNVYADINGNDLPDLAIARITAQNATHLTTMVEKFLDYERNPPTDPEFYHEPLIAAGWQSDRWFVLCAEVVYGYMYYELGKVPVRQYAGTSSPPTQWSTNPNTYMIVNYFGPTGLGYIPNSPSYLTNWTGNATGINAAINDGAFMVLHRDHGSETGWGTPSYTISNLSGLNNEMLPFVFSLNCLTGKYNWSSQCFAEAFHRMNYGALGIIAASEVSYSFVNDTYCWGMWDSMWPAFDPGYGPDEIGPNNLRPCFGSAYGKYYLAASSWPVNPGDKTVTYHLFHHHGDAFITMYSEVPQNLSVVHQAALLGGATEFTVTANDGAIIALTVDGDIIGTAEATGAPVTINIAPQTPGDTMMVTVTLFNYYRYSQPVPIIPPTGPYVIAGECVVDDAAGWNPNAQLDYDETAKLTLTMNNIGVLPISNVRVTISTGDTLLTINDNYAFYGTIVAGGNATVNQGFEVYASPLTPDEHNFVINVVATADTNVWESSVVICGHAPEITLNHLEFNDPGGNNNNWLDPGETADMIVTLNNDGSAPVNSLVGNLVSLDPLLTVNSAISTPVNIIPGSTGDAQFTVTADPSTPQEYVADVELGLTANHGFTGELGFGVQIGNILYDPTGPDAYGYLAYDPYDAPENPEYLWVEISADSGGPGTLVPFVNDDQTFIYLLPFTFTYYGVDYDTFTIGANGWISMGINTVDDYSNSAIPNSDGPSAMIAPYWEDLSPQRANSGKVWQWYDTAQHRLIVEYNHIEQYLPTGSFETFQVILLDPAFYQTSTGDGRIIFQYKDMSAAAQSEGTMGIENYAETIGLQYFFDGTYDIHAHNITNQMAVLYTTPLTGPSLAVTLTPYNTPIVIPPGGGNFSYNLLIANIGTTAANFDGWLEVDLPTGNTISPLVLREGLNLNPGVSITRDLSQSIPGSAPAGLYTYRCCAGNYPGTVYAFDEFEFTKSGVDATSSNTDWTLSGWDDELTGLASSVIPDEYYLEQNVPNPFNPVTMVNFGLPEGGNAELKVFDLLGREVEILYSGWLSAGHHQITFDACYLPSGIYFYQLKVGDFNCVKKMLLIK